MATKSGSYQAVLRSLKAKFELNHKQAQAAYRGIRDRLDKSPTARDIKAHPRITSQEAKRAPGVERAQRAAATRAANRAAREAAAPAKAPRGGKRQGGDMAISEKRAKELERDWSEFNLDPMEDPDPDDSVKGQM